MQIETLHKTFFRVETNGYRLIQKFYYKYSGVLSNQYPNPDDFLNEVFLSISKTDFSEVLLKENYVMRAIKIRCWALIEKAKKHNQFLTDPSEGSTDSKPLQHESEISKDAGPEQHIEAEDLLVQLNLLKAQLKPPEKKILNFLLDGESRSEITRSMRMNQNTVDTHLRRLRLKTADFLAKLGYPVGQTKMVKK